MLVERQKRDRHTSSGTPTPQRLLSGRERINNKYQELGIHKMRSDIPNPYPRRSGEKHIEDEDYSQITMTVSTVRPLRLGRPVSGGRGVGGRGTAGELLLGWAGAFG